MRLYVLTFLLLIFAPPYSTAAQPIPAPGDRTPSEQEQYRPSWKDPEIAKERAFWFAGAGHIYTGEYGRGAALMLGGVAGAAGLTAVLICESSTAWDCEGTGPVGAVSAFLFFGTWIYGMSDADDSAWRVNRRNGYDLPPRSGPTIEPRQDGISVGWRVTVR